MGYIEAANQINIMAKSHTTYTPEEKKEMILAVMGRKTTIQKLAAEKGIAATLISLWKKQAEEAIAARFQPQPRGRRKAVVKPASTDVRKLKGELRKAKARATRMETSLKKAKARISVLENGVSNLAASMGCKLTRTRSPRRGKKA